MYLDFLEFPNLMCFIFVSVWVNLKKNVVNDHQVMGVRNLYTTYIKTGTVYILQLQLYFNKNSNYNRLAHKLAIANLGGPVKRKIK